MGPGLIYPTSKDLVAAIIAAFGKAGIPW